METKLYSMVPVWSSISEDLLAYGKSLAPDYWVSYYNFEATQVPAQLLNRDGFLVALASKRKFHAGILRMQPKSCYNWHVDTDRKVGLNMLIQDGKSHCLFMTEDNGLRCNVKELKYEPDSYYVFNTQVPHMVLNIEQPRYLFSLEFLDEDRGLTFDELLVDIKGMNHGY
jgi:hypothetical protein